MKIVFVTEWTPTPENYNGPSANLYHVFTGLPANCELTIYTTNKNKVMGQMLKNVESALKTDIHIVPVNERKNKIRQKWYIFKEKFVKLKLLRNCYYKLPNAIVKEIDEIMPDFIWLYPHNLISVAEQFCKKYRVVVTGADCGSLHLSRILRDRYVFDNNKILPYIDDYNRMLNTERKWGQIPNTRIVLVGKTDEDYMNNIMGRENSRFFPHPHYNLIDKVISFNKERIKVFIGGKYDMYTYSDSNKMLEAFCDSVIEDLHTKVEFTFHGKSWMAFIDKMKQIGYDVKLVGWVDDYVEFLSGFDVQIFPISVGSGTKGKCLDALSTGLLCIGSDYCFENIAVKQNESALIYKDPKEIPALLKYILLHRDEATIIAQKGRHNIRKYHDPLTHTPDIIEWVINGEYKVNTSCYYRVKLK